MILSSIDNVPLLKANSYLRYISGPICHNIPGIITLESLYDEIHDIEIVAVIDVSGSMIGDKIDVVKSTLRSICTLCDKGSTLSIIAFSNMSQILCDRKPVDKCFPIIDNIVASGGTNLFDGLSLGLTCLRTIPNDRRKAFFAFTDGCVNSGITDHNEIINFFKHNWLPFEFNTQLWLASMGSNSDVNLIKKLSDVSETSKFNHIQDCDYVEFSENIGSLLAICQSSVSGTIDIKGQQQKKFCLPRNGFNTYCFTLSNPADIIISVGSQTISLKTDFQISDIVQENTMLSLITIVDLKNTCLETVLNHCKNPDKNKCKEVLDYIREQLKYVTKLDNYFYEQEKKLLDICLLKLQKISHHTLQPLELCRMSSDVLNVQRQNTSDYTQQVASQYRELSQPTMLYDTTEENIYYVDSSIINDVEQMLIILNSPFKGGMLYPKNIMIWSKSNSGWYHIEQIQGIYCTLTLKKLDLDGTNVDPSWYKFTY